MLLAAYRDQGDFAAAERVAAEITKDRSQTTPELAATQVQLIAAQVASRPPRGRSAEARRLDDRAAALIYEDRARFKNDPTFAQLDCELEIRRGDFTRALALTPGDR